MEASLLELKPSPIQVFRKYIRSTIFLPLLWFRIICTNWWIWSLYLFLLIEDIHLEFAKYQTTHKALQRNAKHIICVIPALQDCRRKTSIYFQAASVISDSPTNDTLKWVTEAQRNTFSKLTQLASVWARFIQGLPCSEVHVKPFHSPSLLSLIGESEHRH